MQLPTHSVHYEYNPLLNKVRGAIHHKNVPKGLPELVLHDGPAGDDSSDSE